jgi:hypothetical protein
VTLKDDTIISLGTYATRMNIQLLKASDFNSKLREHRVPKGVTVQKICRYARNEKEVRKIMDTIWNDPEHGKHVLDEVITMNNDVYEFEKMLEQR